MARHWNAKAYHANHWKTGHWWEVTAVPVGAHFALKHVGGQHWDTVHWIGTHPNLLTTTAAPAHWVRGEWVGQHFVPKHWLGAHPANVVPIPAGPHPVGRITRQAAHGASMPRRGQRIHVPVGVPSDHPVGRITQQQATGVSGRRGRPGGYRDKTGTGPAPTADPTPYVIIYRRRRR